jgi:4-hydroxybenzoate polyprenyltransferase
MIIGIGSSIAYFLGYVTPSYMKEMHGELAGSLIRNYPIITDESIIIGFLIFVVLSIGPLIKDYKDYEGDKKTGVKNIFTIYGEEKAINIVSILLPLTFISPLLLFNNFYDFIIFIPLGIIAGFSFRRYKNTKFIFILYFPILIYCLLRWFTII